MTRRRPPKDDDELVTPGAMEQFLYLLIEMENLVARRLIRWTPADATAACNRLARIARQVSQAQAATGKQGPA